VGTTAAYLQAAQLIVVDGPLSTPEAYERELGWTLAWEMRRWTPDVPRAPSNSAVVRVPHPHSVIDARQPVAPPRHLLIDVVPGGHDGGVTTTSVGELLEAVAARAVRDFEGKHAVVRGGGSAVHAVALVRWLGEIEVPGPVCHVGVSGGELASLRPTTAAVTCRRCLRSLGLDEQLGQPVLNQQLTLFAAAR
jgi:hypothetical protein